MSLLSDRGRLSMPPRIVGNALIMIDCLEFTVPRFGKPGSARPETSAVIVARFAHSRLVLSLGRISFLVTQRGSLVFLVAIGSLSLASETTPSSQSIDVMAFITDSESVVFLGGTRASEPADVPRRLKKWALELRL